MTDMRLLVVVDEPDFGEFVRVVAEGLGNEVRVTTCRGIRCQVFNRDLAVSARALLRPVEY